MAAPTRMGRRTTDLLRHAHLETPGTDPFAGRDQALRSRRHFDGSFGAKITMPVATIAKVTSDVAFR